MDYRRLFRLSHGDRDLERDLEEEIQAHLEMRVEELVRRGVPAEMAREEALRRFGDLPRARRRLLQGARVREGRLRRLELLDSSGRDLVLALRRARRAPGHTVLALTTFALGIGLTTAGFTFVDQVLIRSLPYPEPERLVALQTMDSLGNPIARIASQTWLDWKEQGRTLSTSALHRAERWPLVAEGPAYNIEGQLVTPDFFGVLATPTLLGRHFDEEDVREGRAVAVVSEGLWRRVLGAPERLPVEIHLAGSTRQVVGVVPEGSEYPLGTEAYLPSLPPRRGGESYNWINFLGVGRLAPGVSAEQASADLGGIARATRDRNPAAIYLYGADVIPLQELVVRDARDALLLLLGAVLVLLLIACANLAGLGLARASARTEELAVRISLGAGRRRIVRQLLTEHLLLALLGGALGCALAWAAVRIAVAGAGAHVPRASAIELDARVLLFATAVSLLAGVLAGAAPAVSAVRGSLRAALGGSHGTVKGGRGVPGAALVAAEVALSVGLLAGGGLLARSLGNLLDRELGYGVEGMVAAEADLGTRVPPERQREVWEAMEDRLQAVPGVESVARANWIPTGFGGNGFIEVEGSEDLRIGAGYRVVSDGFFTTLGIRRLAGRGFDERDRSGSEKVVLVNRSMADRYWPGRDPLGMRVRAYSMEGELGVRETAPWRTVVGVVEDIRHFGHGSDPEPEMYVSVRQAPDWTVAAMSLVVRGRPGMGAARLVPVVREALAELDPRLAVEVSTFEDRLGDILAGRRVTTVLVGAFGALSLVLAAIGVFGLLSFAVARRRREIGVRTALGASREGILRLVLGSALRVAAIGAAVGTLAAVWATLLLESLLAPLLVDVAPRDPVSFAASVGVLLLVAVAAALLPAWRAAQVDPLTALRAT